MYTLITAASSGKAYQLKNQLQTSNVLLGDYLDLPEVMLKAGKMIKLPNPQAETYPHLMLTLCLDHQVDTVYLLHREEAAPLTEAELLFNEYGIKLIAAHDEV
ncbi:MULTISPECIES: hypothetical protein [unclassified Mucilaginibacter]|uniref:hypothetical protein n=1 Tax=unclassified Mucilaginibacter TaxID=2617802 RepID=UPI0031F63DBF